MLWRPRLCRIASLFLNLESWYCLPALLRLFFCESICHSFTVHLILTQPPCFFFGISLSLTNINLWEDSGVLFKEREVYAGLYLSLKAVSRIYCMRMYHLLSGLNSLETTKNKYNCTAVLGDLQCQKALSTWPKLRSNASLNTLLCDYKSNTIQKQCC